MIQIKNPCDASWQEMTPAASGKYCGACEKVVVDFSKMNDAQIKNYFTEYASQKICGRFLDSQLDRPLVVPPVKTFNKLLNRLNQIPLARTVLLFITSTSMWISSCVKNNNDDRITTGDSISVVDIHNSQLVDDTASVVKQQDDVLIEDDRTMGEVAIPKTKQIPPPPAIGGICIVPDEPQVLPINIPALTPDTSDTIIPVIVGKVKIADTISQKIKRKK